MVARQNDFGQTVGPSKGVVPDFRQQVVSQRQIFQIFQRCEGIVLDGSDGTVLHPQGVRRVEVREKRRVDMTNRRASEVRMIFTDRLVKAQHQQKEPQRRTESVFLIEFFNVFLLILYCSFLPL